MSEMDDIWQALMAAKSCANSLSTWQRGVDGRDAVRNDLWVIERGIDAHEKLSRQLRNGTKHVELTEDFKATGCMCSWPNASPPCSWCTNPDNFEEE